jgi:acyl-homoserine lactone acylase PvdQ
MPKKLTESVIIRPASERYGQDADFSMFDFIQNELENEKVHAVLTHVPYDIADKMNQQNAKLDNLRAAAIKVVGAMEEGSSGLAAAVRELEAAVKESQR